MAEQQSWISRAAQRVANGLRNIGSNVSYAVQHPGQTAIRKAHGHGTTALHGARITRTTQTNRQPERAGASTSKNTRSGTTRPRGMSATRLRQPRDAGSMARTTTLSRHSKPIAAGRKLYSGLKRRRIGTPLAEEGQRHESDSGSFVCGDQWLCDPPGDRKGNGCGGHMGSVRSCANEQADLCGRYADSEC